MRIALIGYGRMGREVESIAVERGHEVVATFDEDRPVTEEGLSPADVCIEFTHPSAVLHHVRTAAAARKDMVVGTTGWLAHLEEVRTLYRENGLLFAANFSIGVHAFLRIVRQAARIMNRLPDYDPFVVEVHHRQKVDSPSGTALRLAEVLLEEIDRKTEILRQAPDGRISAEQLHVASVRAGTVTGTHTVGFDSGADLLELKHTAKNRRGFALGAVHAAEWIRGRKGVFSMDDIDL